MKKDIRNHPYHFEQALQRQSSQKNIIDTGHYHHHHQQHAQQQQQQQQNKNKNTTYFTWLVFMNTKWVPFDMNNQGKLEQTLHLGGTFVDIEDSNFPKVKRVRVFPKSNYLSYLGVKFRLSRIMQPDAWVDAHHCPSSPTSNTTSATTTTTNLFLNSLNHDLTRFLPYPIRNSNHHHPSSSSTSSLSSSSSSSSSSSPTTQATTTTANPMDHWRSNSNRSSHNLISHVLS